MSNIFMFRDPFKSKYSCYQLNQPTNFMSIEIVAIFSSTLDSFYWVLAGASAFCLGGVFLFVCFNAVNSGQNCSSTALKPKQLNLS